MEAGKAIPKKPKKERDTDMRGGNILVESRQKKKNKSKGRQGTCEANERQGGNGRGGKRAEQPGGDDRGGRL